MSRRPGSSRPLALQDDVLFYGDNLDILRRHVPDESIDLIYLDPPFNSKKDYNILFKESSGEKSVAQIQAFTDFWHWDNSARHTYDYLIGNEVDNRIATVADSLYRLLGKNDMTAYLFMMTTRLIELHRVLKKTGSLYLHCDPTASHYLKILMDAVFGSTNFRNEIVWRYKKYQKAEMHYFTGNSDRILFYVKSSEADKRFKPQFIELDKPKRFLKRVWDKKTGRIVNAKDENGHVTYMEVNREKVDDVWELTYLMPAARERLGYPTQKPEALLERIINASTEEGDWVLDPFCGCGTAVSAAEKSRRHWIGIDITYLAINIIKTRMLDSYPHARFRIEGEPRDFEAAQALAQDRYQFQWWALSLIGARPVGASSGSREGKKGADDGIDGWLRFSDGSGQIERIVVQVKSGHVGVKDIRELRDVVSRQRAAMGIFITLEEPTSEMVKEIKATEPFKHPTWQHEYPTLQIITIKELLKGKFPNLPPTIGPIQEAPIGKRISQGKNETLP